MKEPEPGTLEFFFGIIEKSIENTVRLAAAGYPELAQEMKEITMLLVRQVPDRVWLNENL